MAGTIDCFPYGGKTFFLMYNIFIVPDATWMQNLHIFILSFALPHFF